MGMRERRTAGSRLTHGEMVEGLAVRNYGCTASAEHMVLLPDNTRHADYRRARTRVYDVRRGPIRTARVSRISAR